MPAHGSCIIATPASNPSKRESMESETIKVRITETGIRLVHAKLRFAWPPELDLMARLAGLTLEHRYATFDRQPFSPASAFHVSVYRA